MQTSFTQFQQVLAEKRAVKVIAGIANFNLDHVLSVVRAADAAGAHAVDVAAKPEIVRAVRAATRRMVFASSVSPVELAAAVDAGADVVELGNFDALYDEGQFFGGADVLKLAEETMALVQGRAKVSITIPGHLATDAQVQLAQQLEALGVDLIQTEGAARLLSATPEVKLLSADEKAALTLRNTRALVNNTALPVMTASGITVDNVTEAFQSGAAAVGIGSAVNKLTAEPEMIEVLMAVMAQVPGQWEKQALSQVS